MNVLLLNTMYTGSRYYRVMEPARAVEEAVLGLTVAVRRGVETKKGQRPGDNALTVG